MQRESFSLRARHWFSVWFPVLLGVGVIAVESTPCFGADHTSGPLRHLYEALFGPVSEQRWRLLHHLIRKTGHFVGYGLLGLLWLRAWRHTLLSWRIWQTALLALLSTLLIASADEWHQSTIANRTGSPWDVLLDSTGALTLLLVVCAMTALSRRRTAATAAAPEAPRNPERASDPPGDAQAVRNFMRAGDWGR